ncbi:hypothetical protein DSO57_1002463 [Entomophthora muscae]|uniref:Uncharacterized protein n=1 Tax=Entomophthora muscae TaxID=34485 RepID=A0ACC2TWH6_9FUNG|nr:hypothetical protein DSO57_1002463 [Entomophthora muscae]
MSNSKAQHNTWDATSDSTPPSYTKAWKGYYPLEECLRMYCPETELAKEEKRKKKRAASKAETEEETMRYNIHGVNLLNREPLEICEIEERIKRRKAQHTKVERRRRELLNNSIETLATLLPPSHIDHNSSNARGLILQKTILYLSALKEENANLKYALRNNKLI